MVDETSLHEVVGILKHVEQELDDIAWRKNQAAVALRRGARLDERWATPKLRKADRVRLTEINADLAVVSGAFGGVSRARNRLECFHDWLMTAPGQAPLPFPKRGVKYAGRGRDDTIPLAACVCGSSAQSTRRASLRRDHCDHRRRRRPARCKPAVCRL